MQIGINDTNSLTLSETTTIPSQNLNTEAPSSTNNYLKINQTVQKSFISASPNSQSNKISELTVSVHRHQLNYSSEKPFSLKEFIQKALSSIKRFFKFLIKSLDLKLIQSAKGNCDLPQILSPEKLRTASNPKIVSLSAQPVEILEILSKLLKQQDFDTFKEILINLRDAGKNALAAELIENLLNDNAKSAASSNYKLSPSNQRILEMKPSIGPQNPYDQILKTVSEIYPSTAQYFTKTTIQGGVNISQISNQGMNLILDHLRNKGCFKTVSCQFCPSLEKFSTEIGAFIASPEGGKRTFLVRHRENEDNTKGGHISPVFIDKTSSNDYKIIVTDSVGIKIDEYIENLEKIFGGLEGNKQVYYAGQVRQYDKTNCSIYSIRDAVQFDKFSTEIVGLAVSKHEYIEHKKVNVFSSLPPTWIKTDQSISSIKRYEEKEEIKIPYEKHILTSVEQAKSKINAPQDDFNAKIPLLYLKYERLILTKIISGSILST